MGSKRGQLPVVDPPVPAIARLDAIAEDVLKLAQEMRRTVAELRAVDAETTHGGEHANER